MNTVNKHYGADQWAHDNQKCAPFEPSACTLFRLGPLPAVYLRFYPTSAPCFSTRVGTIMGRRH